MQHSSIANGLLYTCVAGAHVGWHASKDVVSPHARQSPNCHPCHACHSIWSIVCVCACRWGSETAHATLSGSPHLLSSSTTATDSNSKALQQLLGCSEQQLERIVRKAPRCATRLACAPATSGHPVCTVWQSRVLFCLSADLFCPSWSVVRASYQNPPFGLST